MKISLIKNTSAESTAFGLFIIIITILIAVPVYTMNDYIIDEISTFVYETDNDFWSSNSENHINQMNDIWANILVLVVFASLIFGFVTALRARYIPYE